MPDLTNPFKIKMACYPSIEEADRLIVAGPQRRGHGLGQTCSIVCPG